jgi:hypothetical protein
VESGDGSHASGGADSVVEALLRRTETPHTATVTAAFVRSLPVGAVEVQGGGSACVRKATVRVVGMLRARVDACNTRRRDKAEVQLPPLSVYLITLYCTV